MMGSFAKNYAQQNEDGGANSHLHSGLHVGDLSSPKHSGPALEHKEVHSRPLEKKQPD